MAGPFLATITIHQDLSQPVDPGYGVPDVGGGVPPDLGIWPSPGRPAHPIVIPPDKPGEPPVVIWPSPGHPEHPIVLPPGIWPSPGHPAHPIAPGGPPGSIWPGGRPEHPIYLPPIIWPEPPEGGPPIAIDPGHPEHPIVLPTPPGTVWPPTVEHPIVLPLPPEIWPKPGRPAHPIVIPPEPEPDKPPLFTWHVGWTDNMGWVIVAIPNFPSVAPAKKGP